MIRLLACDVDGTLIGHDGVLPEPRRHAVQRLQAAGIPIVLATGKIWSSIRPLWEDLELQGPHVTCNGAAVVDADAKLLASTTLDTDTALEIVKELHAREIPHAVYLDNGKLVTTRRVPALDVLVELGEPDPVPGEIGDRGVLKVLSMVGVDEEDDLRELAADRTQIQRTSHHFLEWTDPSADKAEGLRRVCELLEVPLEHVVAIGDAENDAPMLRAAGTGIAVPASSDAAIAAADLHLASDLTEYLNEVASAATRSPA